ncbi:MAG TPA: ABC transporter substrate binding protein [Deltaproteobacteria bacterium]|jgi:putative ABC transport system substrate-binding protein|nr:ABC transporter substrate binding protein [Deltaproteobacteria bacterium]
MLVFACTALFVFGIQDSVRSGEKVYRVEVLQITDLLLYTMAYEGFVKGLEQEGLVRGKNLVVKRTVIPFDIRKPSLLNRLRGVWRIRQEASRIAGEKPDLVLTIGAPVTKYAKSRIIGAGIPLVFTAVADPKDVDSRSRTRAGPGFTGTSSNMDMDEVFDVIQRFFPKLRRLGIVYTVDDFARMGEVVKGAQAGGLTVLARQVGIGDPIGPALEELKKEGAEAFAVPPDPYYTVFKGRAIEDLIAFSKANRTPIISLVIADIPGAVLSVGVDLEYVGALSGYQASRILKEGVRAESLPILRQEELTVRVDEDLMEELGLKPPPAFRTGAAR